MHCCDVECYARVRVQRSCALRLCAAAAADELSSAATSPSVPCGGSSWRRYAAPCGELGVRAWTVEPSLRWARPGQKGRRPRRCGCALIDEASSADAAHANRLIDDDDDGEVVAAAVSGVRHSSNEEGRDASLVSSSSFPRLSGFRPPFPFRRLPRLPAMASGDPHTPATATLSSSAPAPSSTPPSTTAAAAASPAHHPHDPATTPSPSSNSSPHTPHQPQQSASHSHPRTPSLTLASHPTLTLSPSPSLLPPSSLPGPHVTRGVTPSMQSSQPRPTGAVGVPSGVAPPADVPPRVRSTPLDPAPTGRGQPFIPYHVKYTNPHPPNSQPRAPPPPSDLSQPKPSPPMQTRGGANGVSVDTSGVSSMGGPSTPSSAATTVSSSSPSSASDGSSPGGGGPKGGGKRGKGGGAQGGGAQSQQQQPSPVGGPSAAPGSQASSSQVAAPPSSAGASGPPLTSVPSPAMRPGGGQGGGPGGVRPRQGGGFPPQTASPINRQPVVNPAPPPGQQAGVGRGRGLPLTSPPVLPPPALPPVASPHLPGRCRSRVPAPFNPRPLPPPTPPPPLSCYRGVGEGSPQVPPCPFSWAPMGCPCRWGRHLRWLQRCPRRRSPL